MSLIRRTQIESILGEISSNNSTTTPLSSGGVFMGEADDVSGFKAIGVTIETSHACACSGIQVQFSIDSTNWFTAQEFNAPSGSYLFFQESIQARYFRLIYTNGPVSLTYLRIQTILHPTATIPTTLRVSDDEIETQTLAQLTRSVVAGETYLGNFHNVGTTEDGRLKVSQIETIEGNEWTFANSIPLPAGGNIKFVIHPPPVSASEVLHFHWHIQGKDSYSIKFWEDATTTGGFPSQPTNFNRNRSVDDSNKKFNVLAFPTVSASGSLLINWYLDGGGITSSGVSNRPGDIILKNGSQYLAKIKNESSSLQYISLSVDYTQSV